MQREHVPLLLDLHLVVRLLEERHLVNLLHGHSLETLASLQQRHLPALCRLGRSPWKDALQLLGCALGAA